jgi:uncharacterized protein
MKCPICHKETTWKDNPYRPFCSERCKMLDLGKWASGDYRVKGEESDQGSEKGSAEEELEE